MLQHDPGLDILMAFAAAPQPPAARMLILSL
jgi:hypothetical protein